MTEFSKRFKDPQVWGFFVSVAMMALLAIVFFYPDNFEGNTLMQSDIQQGLANGHEGQAYESATGEKALWTNSLFGGMPTFQISPSYPSNSLFVWLNKVYGLGLPSPSNLLFMMMFGFLILLYCMKMRWYYALIGAVAWGFSSYYIIIIGAGHIWKFVTLAYIPPTIGGLVLCYRGRYLAGAALTGLFAMLQLNANHPQMTYYFGFVMAGLAIAFLAEAVRGKKVKQWAIGTAVAAGAGLLGVGANLPSLYNTYEYAKETKRAQSELTPLAAAEDIAAPAERPTGGLPKGDIVNWSYGGPEMMTLLVPNAKGGATMKPEKGGHVPMTLDRLDGPHEAAGADLHQFLQYFPQYFNDSEGTNGPVYVGALICALFLAGCFVVRGPMKWALVVLTALSMLLALGRNFESLTDFMIYNFPMYSKFRAVESILVIAEFTMPLLAVLALARLLERDDSDRRTRMYFYATFGVAAGLSLLLYLAPGMLGPMLTTGENATLMEFAQQDAQAAHRLTEAIAALRADMVSADALRSFFIIVLGFAAIELYRRGKLSKAVAAGAVGVIVLVDLYTVDHRYVSHDSFMPADHRTASESTFAPDEIDRAILADTAQSFRVLDLPGFYQAGRSYHHKMIGGYHAAKLNRYEDLIQRRMNHMMQAGYMPELYVDSLRAQFPAEDQEIIDQLLADYRVMDMLNARYIITGDKNRPLLLNTNALGNAWFVDNVAFVDGADAEMAALGTLDPRHQAVADRRFMEAFGSDIVAPTAGDTISLTAYTPNRLTYSVTTQKPALAVFSEVWFPWGWKATIDGAEAPLGRVNYILRAMRVPAGHHTVEMEFDPASLHTTGAVAYACVTLIYLLVIGAAGLWYMQTCGSRHKNKA